MIQSTNSQNPIIAYLIPSSETEFDESGFHQAPPTKETIQKSFNITLENDSPQELFNVPLGNEINQELFNIFGYAPKVRQLNSLHIYDRVVTKIQGKVYSIFDNNNKEYTISFSQFSRSQFQIENKDGKAVLKAKSIVEAEGLFRGELNENETGERILNLAFSTLPIGAKVIINDNACLKTKKDVFTPLEPKNNDVGNHNAVNANQLSSSMSLEAKSEERNEIEEKLKEIFGYYPGYYKITTDKIPYQTNIKDKEIIMSGDIFLIKGKNGDASYKIATTQTKIYETYAIKGFGYQISTNADAIFKGKLDSKGKQIVNHIISKLAVASIIYINGGQYLVGSSELKELLSPSPSKVDRSENKVPNEDDVVIGNGFEDNLSKIFGYVPKITKKKKFVKATSTNKTSIKGDIYSFKHQDIVYNFSISKIRITSATHKHTCSCNVDCMLMGDFILKDDVNAQKLARLIAASVPNASQMYINNFIHPIQKETSNPNKKSAKRIEKKG